jgi:TonB family protein
MSRRFACAFLVLLAWSSRARADVSVTPPEAFESAEVPYPAGANGDAVVELEIVVEKDGTVSKADVIDGDPPFAEQARLAVLGWRFRPAMRDGVPIAVRTRARVAFHQEVESAASAPEPALEVKVRGKRREIGQMTISAEDVRQIPGAFGDPFRAIEALPGVTPVVSGLPYMFIRGAPPNNNGYFLDGIRIPLLFHAAFGPSVVHPELLDRVELYAGAAPARYGRFAGAIVAGETREPSNTFRGAANLRLVDAGALLESPFAGGRGTALAAGRYGYPGPIVSAISDVQLGYWDYQSRVAWRLGERDTIGVFAFGSHDYVAHTEPRGTLQEDIVSEFHRVDVRYDRALGDGRARVAATFGYDSQGAAPIYLTNKSGAVRAEIEKGLSQQIRLRAGADARLDVYDLDHVTQPDPMNEIEPSGVDPPPTNFAWGGRADLIWRIAPRVEIVPGARVDVFESYRREPGDIDPRHRRTPTVDPRLSTRVTITPEVAWLSSIGISHQYPTLRIGGIPAAVASGSGFILGSSKVQTVGQVSQGMEVALPADITMTATGFLSSWTGLTDLTAECIEIEPPFVAFPPGGPQPGVRPERIENKTVCPNEHLARGRSFGLELLVRRPFSKRLSGWLSYTLSRSTRTSNFVRLDGSTAVATVPSEFDRTHVLNAILAYDLGRRWRVGSRFAMLTGAPYSRLAGSVPVPPYNSLRDDPFFRLDVRIEKRWPLGKDGSIAFVVEGQNITLSKESSALGEDCSGRPANGGMTTTCKRAEIGPITVPSIGVEAFF